ncbi:MAG: class I SAM-dependent methyltransferase [Candidatus Eisenbacteria bacterium]|nr:class I SAM-dependent methyltransferase [Candidatus Eisenbacteria bacterium]
MHYYQPYARQGELESGGFWNTCSELPGVRVDMGASLKLLARVGERWSGECQWVERTTNPKQYYALNPTFGFASAAVAHAMIREFRPSRIVEVGGGFSTLIIAGALSKNAVDGTGADFLSVEPFPGTVLEQEIGGLTRRMMVPVERVALSEFEALDRGDILFIDSSHVIRYGGDVLYLLLEVLPRLRPGVLVHVHDVHLPEAYPRAYFEHHRWVWNEQYLLQALLSGSTRYEVLLPCWWLHRDHADVFAHAFPQLQGGKYRAGSSFWMRIC